MLISTYHVAKLLALILFSRSTEKSDRAQIVLTPATAEVACNMWLAREVLACGPPSWGTCLLHFYFELVWEINKEGAGRVWVKYSILFGS